MRASRPARAEPRPFGVFPIAPGLIRSRTILLDIGHFDGLTVIVLPPFDALALSLHHSPGVHAILVGSGLSRAAGIQVIKVHGEPPRRT